MSVFRLQQAIKAALAAPLAALPLVTPGRGGKDGLRTPQVHIGSLPPKGDGPDQEFPFVLIVAKSGYEFQGSHPTEVVIRCGVYNREGGGEGAEEDLHNLVSTVRHALLPASHAPLDNRFELQAAGQERWLPWEKPEQQPQPYLEAWIISNWRMPGWQ